MLTLKSKGRKQGSFCIKQSHVAPGYYSTLAHRGFFPVEELKTLRKVGARLQGHPDMKHIPGVDMSSVRWDRDLRRMRDGKGWQADGQGLPAFTPCWATARSRRARCGSLYAGPPLQAGQPVRHHRQQRLQIDGNIADVMSPTPSPRSCALSALRLPRSTATT